MGRKRRRQGRQDRLRREKSSASFNATHPVNPHVSLLCARAAYCINLPQPANHRTCNDQTRTTVSSTGQDNEPDVFAGEDQ